MSSNKLSKESQFFARHFFSKHFPKTIFSWTFFFSDLFLGRNVQENWSWKELSPKRNCALSKKINPGKNCLQAKLSGLQNESQIFALLVGTPRHFFPEILPVHFFQRQFLLEHDLTFFIARRFLLDTNTGTIIEDWTIFTGIIFFLETILIDTIFLWTFLPIELSRRQFWILTWTIFLGTILLWDNFSWTFLLWTILSVLGQSNSILSFLSGDNFFLGYFFLETILPWTILLCLFFSGRDNSSRTQFFHQLKMD